MNKKLSLSQNEKIQKMKKYVRDELEIKDPFFHSCWFVERFLVARKNELPKAKEMIKEYFKFRKKMINKINFEKKPAGNLEKKICFK